MPHVPRRLVAPLVGACALVGASAAAATPPPPVPVIDWQPCQQSFQAGFECATAVAPLDYDTPQDGRTVELALIRKTASKPSERIGTMLFNPGGPGGPGTVEMPAWFAKFPKRLTERFDIVSWDPRSVGFSTAVQCFPTDEQGIEFFDGVPYPFPVGAQQSATFMSAYVAFGDQCRKDNADLMKHSSTADTARDMDLLRRAFGEETISYYGVSYGTFLGATYVNMFPSRIRKAVLDGNVAPSAWTNDGDPDAGFTTTGYRVQTHKGIAEVWKRFLTLCAAAGPDDCAFAGKNERATFRKWRELVARTRQAPIPFNGTPVTYAALMEAALNLAFVVETYGPFAGWTGAVEVLEVLYEGGSPGTPQPPKYADPENGSAVECGDSPNPTKPWRYPAIAAQAFREAPDFGPVVTYGDATCVNWSRQEDTYTGPFDRWTPTKILVIGNRYDPSTPYVNSLKMTRELRRGHLLTVDGYGHTVLLNSSACASRRIEDYMIEGRLPRRDLVCEQDVQPFQDS